MLQVGQRCLASPFGAPVELNKFLQNGLSAAACMKDGSDASKAEVVRQALERHLAEQEAA